MSSFVGDFGKAAPPGLTVDFATAAELDQKMRNVMRALDET